MKLECGLTLEEVAQSAFRVFALAATLIDDRPVQTWDMQGPAVRAHWLQVANKADQLVQCETLNVPEAVVQLSGYSRDSLYGRGATVMRTAYLAVTRHLAWLLNSDPDERDDLGEMERGWKDWAGARLILEQKLESELCQA